MNRLGYHALQASLYGVLTQDGELTTLITGVYDTPPESVLYPYISFGKVQALNHATKTNSLLQTIIELNVFSQTGRGNVIGILDRIFDVLQTQEITLEGHHLVAMRFDYNEVAQGRDGRTHRGLIRYRAYTEEMVA